jgi:hypothetical protein
VKEQLVYLGVALAKSDLDAAIGAQKRRFSNDTIGHGQLIKWVKWRRVRFGLNCFRLIKRLTVTGEIPPRYSHASLSFRAPWFRVLVVLPTTGGCLVSLVFIYLLSRNIQKTFSGISSKGHLTLQSIRTFITSPQECGLSSKRALLMR